MNQGLVLLMPSATIAELPSSVVMHVQQRIYSFIMSRKKNLDKSTTIASLSSPSMSAYKLFQYPDSGFYLHWKRGEGGGGGLQEVRGGVGPGAPPSIRGYPMRFCPDISIPRLRP